MADYNAELILDCQNVLGEGVQWSTELQRLYWVDIHGAKLLSCDEFGQNLIVHDLDERLCAFAFDPDGHILGAFASGFYRLNTKTFERELIQSFEAELPNTRLNDGRCDRVGRFVCGGYDEGTEKPLSSVVSYQDGHTKTIIQGVTCSNSIGFSSNGQRMYFADSYTKDILCYDYDQTTGTVSNKRTFVTLNEDEGAPDGSVVDADDSLWNAQYGGGRVQQFLQNGSRGKCIKLPVPNVTCVCFGGENLDKMFITTARENLSTDELKTYPASGGLFMVQTNTKGRTEDGLKERLFP